MARYSYVVTAASTLAEESMDVYPYTDYGLVCAKLLVEQILKKPYSRYRGVQLLQNARFIGCRIYQARDFANYKLVASYEPGDVVFPRSVEKWTAEGLIGLAIFVMIILLEILLRAG